MKRSEQLIQKIREAGIEPLPRSRFVWRRVLLWLSFAVSVVLGALAFSVILFAIQQTDFSLLQHLEHSRLELFLGLLPFLWLAFLAVFLLLAMYALRHSPRGYKLNLLRLAAYSAALSMVLGTAVFLGGGAQQLEESFALRVSQYESIQEKKMQLWSMPAAGYLSGTITVRGEGSLQLTDFNGQSWTIDYEAAFLPPVVQLIPDEQIKLIGEQVGESHFVASEIRPWGGRNNRPHGRE
jgi:hypothetical protein